MMGGGERVIVGWGGRKGRVGEREGDIEWGERGW